jgi:glutamyl-tRNA(Gln) amidotransferase subunit D
MYSKRVADFLKANGIEPGDMVKLTAKGSVYYGELMPRSDAGNEDSVVIKLKNGYNIGVRFENARIERVSSGERSHAFPRLDLRRNAALPKVSLVYTGGTIGSKLDYKTGGVYMLLKPEELFYEVPEIAEIADIEPVNLMSIASEDMSPIEWRSIAKEAEKAFDKGARGIVITHGTDTMHYTSAALSFMLKDFRSPVVLTGAQRSSDRGSSDAFTNLIASTIIAAKSRAGEVGICMHDSPSDDVFAFIRGTRARKMHTSRRDAFRSINDGVIAYARTDGTIEYRGAYRKAEQVSAKALTGFESKVALVKTYPGSDPGIIGYYADKGYKGIIIEGTGLGHTPVSIKHKGMSWLPVIKEAVDSGMVVGMTSQTIYGRVNPYVYRNLRLLSGAGVIYCEDMTPETAYVKLGWLLGNYKKDEAHLLLNRNVAGEIKGRSMIDEFLV